MFFILELPHLPHPPQHFIDRAFELIKEVDFEVDNLLLDLCYTSDYLERKLTKDGKQINSRVQHAYEMGDEWDDWVKQNLVPEFIDNDLRMSLGKDTDTHGPHTDSPEKWKLYYLLDRGAHGEDAETVFYHKPGMPLTFTGNSRPDDFFFENNIDSLVPVFRYRIPLRKWIVLNGTILHGVEKAGLGRLNLAVSMPPNSLNFTLSKEQ